MTDLNEESLGKLLEAIREPMRIMPTHVVVSQEGLGRMKKLCADDAEFRQRVLAEFPQFEGVL